ncbi:centromere protein V-like [Asterias amurensis]|uniref:centromere protein V-like n=1 Tax=Asterias amurensis TaxID=7602 RepID=UPI003AB5FFF5
MTDLVKHTGGCHCGAVKFEALAPRDVKVFDCNCSICTMKQNKHFIVNESNFKILRGEDNLTCYTFNTKQAKHTFCKTCGVQSFYTPRSNQNGKGIAIHCVDKGTIDNITIMRFDGQNWEESLAADLENIRKLSAPTQNT